jgi:macrolide transport system ATP-binding/permease protein
MSTVSTSSTLSTRSTGTQLVALDILVTYGACAVLPGVDLRASAGQRVGVVGENGSGKSTLLRVLAGEQTPDAGTVRRPPDLVHLAQDPVFPPGATVGSVRDQALAPMREAVLDLERRACDLARGGSREAYADALAWAEEHDAWDAERRAELAAGQLGVAVLDPRREVASLSGGERSRLAMAAVLTRRPACLLLDEPTNHLDDAAVDLVEQACLDLPGIVVLASHDRVFLDRVCTHLIDLDPAALGTDGHGGNRFTGGFSDYLQLKASARARWEETYREQQEGLVRLRAATTVKDRDVAPGRGPRDNDKFVTKFKGARVERTVARRIHDAERRLEVAERETLPRPPAPLRLRARLGGRGGAVEVGDLRVDGRLALDRLSLGAGGRLLVTGANGSGKSTLLCVLAGRLRARSGSIRVTGRVGLLDQDTRFTRPGVTAQEAYAGAVGVERAEEVPLRSLGLLPPSAQDSPVGALSIGQQRRLALAVLLADPPDLLLLDEPTNHLSLTLVTELEEALRTATGTVVIASHDRWLRRGWDGETLVLGGR